MVEGEGWFMDMVGMDRNMQKEERKGDGKG